MNYTARTVAGPTDTQIKQIRAALDEFNNKGNHLTQEDIVELIKTHTGQDPEKTDYIPNETLAQLENIQSDKFDLSKLIQLCKELNIAWKTNSHYLTIFAVRAIVDHVPPIFGFNTFKEVCNNFGPPTKYKSFKSVTSRLKDVGKEVGNIAIHDPIKKTVPVISSQEVDFRIELITLLNWTIDRLANP